MDIPNKNKNENTQIRDPDKVTDVFTDGRYLNKKIVDERPIASSFPSSLIHFSSVAPSSNNSNKSLNDNDGDDIKSTGSGAGVSQLTVKNTDPRPLDSSFSSLVHFPSTNTKDNDKIADYSSIESKAAEKRANRWWSISPISQKSQESFNDYRENKIANSDIISKNINNIEKPSASINIPSTTLKDSDKISIPIQKDSDKIKTADVIEKTYHQDAKVTDEKILSSPFFNASSAVANNNEKSRDSDKISIPIQKNNEKTKLANPVLTNSKVAEKPTKKWWSIFSSNKKSVELPKVENGKEKKVSDSDATSKIINEIKKAPTSINVSSTFIKDKEKPLSSDKLPTLIQQKNNEKIEIKPEDSLSTKPNVTKKPAKKWWSIFSISEESRSPIKNDKEKNISNQDVVSKTVNDIAKVPLPISVSSVAANNNEKPKDIDKISIPIQKDSEKIEIKPADGIAVASTAIKTADKMSLASSPSPFGIFVPTIAKDDEKPLDNEKLLMPIKKESEAPLVSIQKNSEKIEIKPADSSLIKPKIAEKTAKKWWSIFSNNKKFTELLKDNSEDEKEKKISNSNHDSKIINEIEKSPAPAVSIGGNEIVKSNIDQEVSKERPKFNTKEPCIKVDQLRVIYNKGKSNEVRSLDGVDVEIYPEEYIIIFGPSGCGKSTLLYGISGLQAPTYGDVTVLGKNLSQMTKREKVEFHQTKIGMVFQAFYLIETLTVIDNVCLPKVFRGEPLKERREKAMELLKRFSIAEQADKFPAQLSGGQKQRVSIARALVNDPEIILADEPVGNLDSESAQNVLDIFKEINETDKKTLIMVTHNPEHLVYADRIIHMKDGKKVREEINTDKRPKEAIEKDISINPEEISGELKLLMRTFKNLSLQQIGVLLIPFKAKQLISHILSALKEEQIAAAENFLKDLLFKNIDNENFEKRLDLDLVKGGAGWNKLRAISFAHRVQEILEQAEGLKAGEETAIITLTDYLIKLYNLKVDAETILRFRNFVKLRVENKIDRFGLQQRIDAPKALGGVGLYKGSAEKVVDEIELIMLLKYSEQ